MLDRSRKKRSSPRSRTSDAFTKSEEGSDEWKAKNPAAVALGRLGGKKGGPARAARLSAGKRKSIARKAAKARWAKYEKSAK